MRAGRAVNSTDGEQPVVISVGACRCSGGPHAHPDGDTVTLRRKVGLEMGLAATGALRRSGNRPGDIQAALGVVYLRYGIEAWTFHDKDGPVPINADTIDKWLPWNEGGYEVADRADDLYGGTVLAPLLKRSDRSPARTAAPPSTSQNPPSGEPHPISRPPSSRSHRAGGKRSVTTGASQ